MTRLKSDSSFYEAALTTRREFAELRNSSNATISMFVAIGNDCRPENWSEAPKLRDGNSFAETYVEPIYEKVLSKEGILDWFSEELDGGYDEDEMEETWMIGEFTQYEDVDSFIDAIDFDILQKALKNAWKIACSS